MTYAALRRLAARTAWPFIALAAVLLAVLFKDAILHGGVLGQADLLTPFQPWQANTNGPLARQNPILTDVPTVFYPFLVHARDAIRNGIFPLWTTGIYAGHPFFASYQSALLSPFTAIAYLVPLPQATVVIAAARLFVGGMGMYVFLRRLALGVPAAVFGGTAFLLNPFSVVWLEHPLSAVASWLPWLLVTADAAVTKPGGRSAGALAVVTALTLLAGHPETAFKVFLLAAAYAAVRAATLPGGFAVGGLGVAAGGMILGTLLASVQILPFLEYLRRSRVFDVRSRWTAPQFVNPAVSFVTAFVPDFFGNPVSRRYALDSTNYCEQQVYPGIATWLLAAASLVTARRRGLVSFFAAAAVVATLIMYGTVVSRVAVFLVPPLKMAALSRFGLLAIACLIVLAAIGMDDLLGDAERGAWRRAAVALAAVAIAILVFTVFHFEHPVLVSGRVLRATERAAVASGVLALVTVLVVYVAGQVSRTIVAGALIALISVDLLRVALPFHPMTPASHVFPRLAELDVIAADTGVYRVTGWNDVLQPNASLVYGTHDFRGYDGLGPAAYLDLLDVGFKDTGPYHALVNAATPHLLDLLNIKYVLTPADVSMPGDRFTLVGDGSVRVYRNDRVQPRAFLADAFVVLQGDAARRAIRGATVDLTRTAVLDAEPPPAEQPQRAVAGPGRATLVRYEDERIDIRTSADGPRLLVLSDLFYPGWEAKVDGVPAPIRRADYAFRAVAVPAGHHVVRFDYKPASFMAGLLLSAVAAASVTGLWVMPLLARRRAGLLSQAGTREL